jgi:hypothetical protein
MVKSVCVFEKLCQVDSGCLSNQSMVFLVHAPNVYDPSMLCSHLDERNMVIMSIMLFGQFWVSTYAPLLFSKALHTKKHL